MKFAQLLLAGALLTVPGYSQPDLTISSLKTAGIITATQTLAVSGTLALTVKNIGTTGVAIPFHILAWEDRDGNGQFNLGTDVALGSLLYSGGLAAGTSVEIPIPISGTVLFRGNLIFAQVDSENAVSELLKTNNIVNTGQFASPVATSCPSSAPNGMKLTADAIAQGYCLNVFADNFPATGFCCGPLGIAFPDSGGVLISDGPGNVRRFPVDTDGQHANAISPSQSYGAFRAVGLVKANGKIYMADQSGGQLLRLNDNGTLNSVVLTGLGSATGVAANPVNGHVFVSALNGIWDIDPNSRTAVRFNINTAQADGLTISSDGTVIYAAINNHIMGFKLADAAQVFDTTVTTVDGTALGTGSLAGSIFANTNDGRVWQTILATGQQILIASGGSRGDFVTVDPNGTLLVTQTDTIYRLTPPAGGSFAALPDLTSSFIRKNDAGFPASVQLIARIGNGGAPFGHGTAILYSNDFEGTVGSEWSNARVETAPASGRRLLGRYSNDTVSIKLPDLSQYSTVTVSFDLVITGSMDGDGLQCSGCGPDIWTATAMGRGTLIQTTFANDIPAEANGWRQHYPGPFVPGRGQYLPGTGRALRENLGFPYPGQPLGGDIYRLTFQIANPGAQLVLSFSGQGMQGVDDEGWGLDNFVVEAGASTLPVNIAFYEGDPASGGSLIGTTRTSKSLASGDYDDISVTWNTPPAGAHPIVVVADDDGTGHGAIAEGDETNNKAGANILLGVGPFTTVDDLTARSKSTEVDLRWSPITGATGYNVYRRIGSSSATLVGPTIRTTALADTGLVNGTLCYYSVRWLDGSGKESGEGTEASGTPTASTTTETPPTILSSPVVRATALTAYSYPVRASDPDIGDALTYSIVSPPVGMTISAAGLISWMPNTAQGGYSRIQLQVQDKKGHLATQSYYLFVDVQLVNQPPVITSTPITLATSGQLYAYQVVAHDPQNGLLFWSLDSAPQGMTINQSTGLIQWTPTRTQVGSQNVSLHVTAFAGLSSTQSFAISVARGNKAPQFTSSPLTNARDAQLYVYAAAATDPDSDPITFSLAAAPSGMTVSAGSGLVQWTPTAAQVGSQTVSLRVADDSGLNSLQNFVITVRAANQPPSITSTPITSAQTSTLYSYPVTATDPDLPNDGLTFSLVVFPAGMTIGPNTGLIQWTPSASVQNTTQNVTVRVNDLAGASASQTLEVKVTAPDMTPPTVSIASPATGAQLTNDTVITGTATDANLKSWILEYQISGASSWTTLSTSAAPVVNGTLGTLPATLLANDPYRLRLTASDFTQSNSTTIEVHVNTGQLKLGDFTLSFEDVRVPGFTFPISILRKYDSKRATPGDFGPGWTLGFNEVDVRVDVNDNVFLTLPDARRVSFQFTPQALGFGVFNTAFTGQGGVYDQLENLDCPQVLGSPGNYLCNGFQAWQPTNWRLKTKDGLTYTIADGSVTRIEDRAGNWIQIAATGITSNTGRNVTIERDAQNRITRMAPPSPGGDLRYQYDLQGRLVTFLDQNSKATTFAYENANFPHYLTKITDPLGRQLVRNVFNAEGRLVAQCDPNGNINTLVGCSQFNSQPGSKTFTAINGRGFRTDLITDERGNILSERHYLDATNFLETVRTYDANNNTNTERDPEGNQRTYTYDPRGNRWTETDPGLRKTTYTYAAGCDKVATITDPAGNTTTNTYDAQCNLRFVRDALNKTTEYRYNSAGQRTQMIDPNGTTWTWVYGANGLLQNVTDPFGKATTFGFDDRGNLLTKTDRNGRRIDLQYDPDNRLKQEKWDNGRISTFVYDDTGALVSAVDPDSNLTMSYDNLGRLVTVDNLGTPGAPRVAVTYTYDANGNTTRVQDSLGGNTDYTYDALDRLSRVTQSGSGVQPKRVNMEYSAAGILTQLKRFGDLQGTLPVANTMYEYDCGGCAGRLTAIRHRKASDNSVIHDLTFVRDALGNITSSTDAEGAHSYTYDAVRRLTSATHPPGGVQPNETYTYDAVGNRLTSHLSHFYTYSWQTVGKGDRLLQDNQFDYSYDNEGNLTRQTDRGSGTHTDFAYDHRNRMTSAIEKTSTGVDLAASDLSYDSLNRRIRAVELGQIAWFGYDGLNPTIKLTPDGDVISRRVYAYFLDDILADEVAGVTRWYFLDEVGSVRDIGSNAGSVSTHNILDSFGRAQVPRTFQIQNDLMFAGRELTASGRLNYFRARVYDSFNGRFTSEDVLEPFSYAYGNNNPLVYSDPTGEDFVEYLFARRTGILNSNNFARIGYGWNNIIRCLVFRIAIGSASLPIHWHIDLWRVKCP